MNSVDVLPILAHVLNNLKTLAIKYVYGSKSWAMLRHRQHNGEKWKRRARKD